MATVNLAAFDIIVADTSFFVRVERFPPPGSKLASLKRLALKQGVLFRVPLKVKIELIDKPASPGFYCRSVSRLRKEMPSKWVEVESFNYTRRISEICDAGKKRIASVSGRSEIEIERADFEVIGLVFSYAYRGKKVGAIFRDRAMKNALQALLRTYSQSIQQSGGSIEIIDAEQVLAQL